MVYEIAACFWSERKTKREREKERGREKERIEIHRKHFFPKKCI